MRIIFYVLFFIFMADVHAAEIININYKYKIAFTDLTENDVKPGDIIHVTGPDGRDIPLKVLETFPVMSKVSSPDGANALTEEQFKAITVGSPVVVDRARAGAAPAVAEADDEKLVHVESFSPGMPPVQQAAPALVPYEVEPDPRERTALLEKRLDQMMANNVQLAENITQLMAEKSAAEAIARNKEAEAAAARKKAASVAQTNEDLLERLGNLEAASMEFDQERTAQQKKIAELESKIGELRKKLAKMVDIVNTNTKAYEKQ